MAVLTVRNVRQAYGSRTVIDDLSFTLGSGVHALLGPNGAGKTTLLRTLATVVPPVRGHILIDRVELTGPTLDEVRRRIGYLPQNFGIDPAMTVAEFVYYAAWARGVPKSLRKAAVGEALEKVDLVGQRAIKMKRLSGGMVQRSGIAWAIVGNPVLILLDEPTVGLDPLQRIQFREIIARQRDSVVVLSTHLTDDADAIADSVIVLDDGAMRFQGSPAELAQLGTLESPGATPIERGFTSLIAIGAQAEET